MPQVAQATAEVPAPKAAQAQPTPESVSIPTPTINGTVAGFATAETNPIGTGLTAQTVPQQTQFIPRTAATRAQQPVPFARSQAIRTAQLPRRRPVAQVNFNQAQAASPVQMGMGAPGGIAQANFDQPQLPGYSWPSYSAHPNYAAVTYPNQYSATAWPYIGPFYPYPQVPLGWRKVTLEWDDGWWFLDFKSK